MDRKSNMSTEASANFTTIDEALRHCGAEVEAGWCAIVWPSGSAGYRVASWSFESKPGQPALDNFAPTMPQSIDESTYRRPRVLLRLPALRRRR
jgi:hypothetical protein